MIKPSVFAPILFPDEKDQWQAGFYTPVGFFAPSRGESKQSFMAFIDQLSEMKGPMDAYTALTPDKHPSIQS